MVVCDNGLLFHWKKLLNMRFSKIQENT